MGANAAAVLMGGNILFAGSLYALVLTEQKALGMVAPLGGTLYIVGWLMLAFAS